jgi:hypothetical protein
MNSLPHIRYLAPKWQAYITQPEKSFVFANGVVVRSLWELKEALLTLPEDIVNNHVNNSRNDFANWVEFVVGDKELGEEMRRYNHRWGMIVTMERQLMRTLSLPHYVAQRWLGKAPRPFVFVSGEQANSLEELAVTLNKVSEETVAFHNERVPNDIVVWVMDVVGDYELAEILSECSSRQQMTRIVEDHLAMLKEAAVEE